MWPADASRPIVANTRKRQQRKGQKMVVRIEKDGPVWTVIHDRPEEARNAMDLESADALKEAFLQFDADDTSSHPPNRWQVVR
jgi:hypothetical protein